MSSYFFTSRTTTRTAAKHLSCCFSLLSLFVVTVVLIAFTTTQPTTATNTTTTLVPANLFAGAPYEASSANITVIQQLALPVQKSLPEAGTALTITMQINSPNLQWNTATAQFAKSLFISANAGHSVFAPSRMLDEAPWFVAISGTNTTQLSMQLIVGACIDPPRRSTTKGAQGLALSLHVPPSATNPPLTSEIALGDITITLPSQSDGSTTSDIREIIGTVFFSLLLVCCCLIFWHDGGSGATELLWAMQTMLAVADSPCAKHSFYSFIPRVFWMLRVSMDPRSIVPALLHTLIILIGVGVSFIVSSKARTPQARLQHPRIGLFFVCIFVLGGIQSGMLLTIAGVPDLSLSKDLPGRAIGIVTVIINIVTAIAFTWSGIGSPALLSLRLEKVTIAPTTTTTGFSDSETKTAAAGGAADAGDGGNDSNSNNSSSFFIDTLWRPVTAAKRSSPIAGIFGPIAYAPRRLAYLVNFLPFFISLLVHVVLTVLLSIDTNNIGGCVATLSTCICIHLFFCAYAATGHSVCRSQAWAYMVTLTHFGRAAWCCAALLHLDCNGSAADVDAMTTVLAVIGLVCVLAAAVLGVLAAKKEQLLTSNKLKIKNGSSPQSSPTRALLQQQQQNSNVGSSSGGAGNFTHPEITVTRPGVSSNPLLETNFATGEGVHLTAGRSTSPASAPSSPTRDGSPSGKNNNSSSDGNNRDKKKQGNIKAKKPLPPPADGTGEIPASPLFGGISSSAASSPMMVFPAATSGPASPSCGGGGVLTMSALSASLGLDKKGNNSLHPGAPTLALRDAHIALLDNSQRPRGQSLESRLSSGSGGHEGPGGKRSPSSSFGPGVAAHCYRCGLPARPSPTGGKALCGQCRSAIAMEGLASSWDFGSSGNLASGTAGASSSGNGGSMRMTGGRSHEMGQQQPQGSANISLPSWEAQTDASGNTVARGIVQLPSWRSGQQQQQQQHHVPVAATPVAQDDDDDFL